MAMPHLVWDMDGTLLDSSEVVPDAFIATARALGSGDVDRQQVVAAYSLGVPEVVLEHLIGRRLADGEADSYYDRLQDSSVYPYDGVHETLATLRARDLPVTIFTGASSRAARTLLSSAGIDYDILVGGDHVAHPKPSPDGVLAAAKRLAVDVAHVVYIGDAPTDLQAARSAGARGAAATWGHLYEPSEPADSRLTTPSDALDLLGA
jgi:HAD superfamily hydrolase (TIGR01549 family)